MTDIGYPSSFTSSGIQKVVAHSASSTKATYLALHARADRAPLRDPATPCPPAALPSPVTGSVHLEGGCSFTRKHCDMWQLQVRGRLRPVLEEALLGLRCFDHIGNARENGRDHKQTQDDLSAKLGKGFWMLCTNDQHEAEGTGRLTTSAVR